MCVWVCVWVGVEWEGSEGIWEEGHLGVGGSVLMSVLTMARNLANSNRSGSKASHWSFASYRSRPIVKM